MAETIIDFGEIQSDSTQYQQTLDRIDMIDFGGIDNGTIDVSTYEPINRTELIDYGNFGGIIDTSSDRYFTDRVNLVDYGNIIYLGGGGSQTSLEVYDMLDSTNSLIALSANMGRVLDEKILAYDSRLSGIELEIDSHITNESVHLSQAQRDILSQMRYDLATNTLVFLGNIDFTAPIENHTHAISDVTGLQQELQSLQDSISTISTSVSAHESNSVVHVTQEDKNRWNEIDSFWSLDENGNLYTTYNTYSTKDISAYGAGDLSQPGSGVSTLDELSDVTITLPSIGQYLTFNGTHWVNTTQTFVTSWADLTGKPLTIEELGVSNIALESDLLTHTSDPDIHLSSSDRIAITNLLASSHTHTNKAEIDSITQAHINLLSYFSVTTDGKIKVDADFFSTGGVSAYGEGTSTSGSSYERLDSWDQYDPTKSGWVLSAGLGVELDGRIDELSNSVSQLQAGSGDKHYYHYQSVPSSQWDITHNLAKKPAVTVLDSAGTEVIGDVTHHDTNSLTIKFDATFSGSVYLN